MHRRRQPFVLPIGPIGLVALGVMAVLLGAAPARAATIVIVRPGGVSPALTETVSRLHGELLSLGIDVAFAERPGAPAPPPADPRAWLEPIASARGADAVIHVGEAEVPEAIDIYVVDRSHQRSELARVVLEPDTDNPAAWLAIRTIEVLRSSLVEIDLAARGRPEAVAARPASAEAPAAPRAPAAAAERVGLEVGAALLTSLDGVGPALLPTVRAGWAAGPGLVLHAALAGFGSRPALEAPAGRARVAQQLAVVGACTCAPAPERIRPFVALSAGALHTAIDGEADGPAQAHAVDRWSFLLDVSAGARLRLPGRTFLTLAAHAQLAAPYVAVHIADTLVATTGRPNLLVSLTVGAWL